MDYLRHQIEASLGRSEELLTTDKARRIFYRYPSSPVMVVASGGGGGGGAAAEMQLAPLPLVITSANNHHQSKKTKERSSGTFNSVRLKKYLGFGGSKRKPKVDCSDDLQQQLQQYAYLEELQRYGAPLPPNLHHPHPHYHPHHPQHHYEATVTRYHPSAACYDQQQQQQAWPTYDKGTMSPARTIHFPNVYSTVSAAARGSSRQRSSLQSAVYAWEPYGQSPIAAVIESETAASSPKDNGVYRKLRCPCTCEDQPVARAKRHRSKCTCGSSTVAGTRRGGTKVATNTRPSLFGIGDLVRNKPTVLQQSSCGDNDDNRALAMTSTNGARHQGKRQDGAGVSGAVVVIRNDNYINGYSTNNMNINNNNNSPRVQLDASSSSSSSKSRLHRLSDVSTPNEYGGRESTSVVLTTFQSGSSSVRQSGSADSKLKRRSILETTVNPYELLVKSASSGGAVSSVVQTPPPLPPTNRRALPGPPKSESKDRLMTSSGIYGDEGSRHEKDGNGNTDHKQIIAVNRQHTNGYRKPSASSKKSQSVVDEDEVTDISLGGQRIRLFGTVKGTSPTNRHNNGYKRGSIPTFSESPAPSLVPNRPAPPPPPPPPPQRSSSFLSYTDFREGIHARTVAATETDQRHLSAGRGNQQSSSTRAIGNIDHYSASENRNSNSVVTAMLRNEKPSSSYGAPLKTNYSEKLNVNNASTHSNTGNCRSETRRKNGISGCVTAAMVNSGNKPFKNGTLGLPSTELSPRDVELPIDYDWQEQSDEDEFVARRNINDAAWHKTTIKIGNTMTEKEVNNREYDFRSRLANVGSPVEAEKSVSPKKNYLLESPSSDESDGYINRKFSDSNHLRSESGRKLTKRSPDTAEKREDELKRFSSRSPQPGRRHHNDRRRRHSNDRMVDVAQETDDEKLASKVSPYASSVISFPQQTSNNGDTDRNVAARLTSDRFGDFQHRRRQQQSNLPLSATVITVGQNIGYTDNTFDDDDDVPISNRVSRLSLKINLSDLSAYLKPILKKATFFNESSTSSDTDLGGTGQGGGGGGSDSSNTYGGSTDGVPGGSNSIDGRQKQKKHVHFLAHRVSTGSEESLSKEWTNDEEEQDGDLRSSSNESLENGQYCKQEAKDLDGERWGDSSSDSRLSSVDINRTPNGTSGSSSCNTYDSDNDDGSVCSQQELYADGSSGPREELDNFNSSSEETTVPEHQWPDRLSAPTDHSRINNRSCVKIGVNVMPLKDIEGHISSFMRRKESLVISSVKENIAPASVLNDHKRTSLRRSQSERQISGNNDESDHDRFGDNLRSSPTRSNSFQVLLSNVTETFSPPPSNDHSELEETSRTRLTNSAVTKNERNASVSARVSNSLTLPPFTDSQPVYQNNSKDGVSHSHSVSHSIGQRSGHFGAGLSAVSDSASPAPSSGNSAQHFQSPTSNGGQHFRKFNSSSAVLQESSLLKRIKELNGSGVALNGYARRQSAGAVGERWSSTSGSHASSSSFMNSPCLPPANIAKLRAIPKFLPRPHFNGKHLHHVCALYSDTKIAEVQEPEEDDYDDGGAVIGSQWESEEDLYADGESSSLNSTIKNEPIDFNKSAPLPPIPTESPPRSPTPSFGDNSDDSVIYEQIGEPVYEEVNSNLTYNSATSTSGSLGLPRKSIFEGASKTEILSYLEDAKERGVEHIETSSDDNELLLAEDEPVEELAPPPPQTSVTKRHHRNRVSNISNLSDSSQTSEESFQNDGSQNAKDRHHSHSSSEVERNDSGVGSETGKPSRLRRQPRVGSSSEQVCVDCDQALDSDWDSDDAFHVSPLVCKKCSKKRSERKEIILEFVETEVKYGRDLKIIKEEFHRPMLVAGLLTEEQLNNIFINLDQLIVVNDIFAEKLKDALDIAAEQGDEDYSNVDVGKVFQESSAMLHAFEGYCIRQGSASMLLTNLEKEKELLRVFLKVSQMENTLLRRLNLNSFLMVPVQRITKYPLLLNRLYKVTPHHHQDRESLRESQLKVELHLEHINQAKDFSGMNLWRRISNISNSQRRNLLEPVIGNIKLRKMALEVLQWSSEEVRYVMEGRLQYMQITENLWNKKERTLKLTPIHGLLITLGTPNTNYRPDLADRDNIFPRNTGIKEATLVLIKEKNSRYNLLREPLLLQKCVISSDQDIEDVFEVQEFTSKDAYLLKGDDGKDTQEWLKMLRYHAKDLGAWRRRRNALANIMINGMVARREWL